MPRRRLNTILQPLGASMGFTGGAEETPFVTVVRFIQPGSVHHNDKVLFIKQDETSHIRLSVQTMKDIIAWAEVSDEDLGGYRYKFDLLRDAIMGGRDKGDNGFEHVLDTARKLREQHGT